MLHIDTNWVFERFLFIQNLGQNPQLLESLDFGLFWNWQMVKVTCNFYRQISVFCLRYKSKNHKIAFNLFSPKNQLNLFQLIS